MMGIQWQFNAELIKNVFGRVSKSGGFAKGLKQGTESTPCLGKARCGVLICHVSIFQFIFPFQWEEIRTHYFLTLWELRVNHVSSPKSKDKSSQIVYKVPNIMASGGCWIWTGNEINLLQVSLDWIVSHLLTSYISNSVAHLSGSISVVQQLLRIWDIVMQSDITIDDGYGKSLPNRDHQYLLSSSHQYIESGFGNMIDITITIYYIPSGENNGTLFESYS